MLIILSGLPGTGKSTIAKALAARLKAAYVRVDTIEQALLASGEPGQQVGVAGYLVAYGVAADSLRAGVPVVADSVNPLTATRRGWRAVARAAGCPVLEVGVTCSDAAEHRRRVETRTAEIPGHVLPTWQDVIRREFEPWEAGTLVIDTAASAVEAAVGRIVAAVSALPDRSS